MVRSLILLGALVALALATASASAFGAFGVDVDPEDLTVSYDVPDDVGGIPVPGTPVDKGEVRAGDWLRGDGSGHDPCASCDDHEDSSEASSSGDPSSSSGSGSGRSSGGRFPSLPSPGPRLGDLQRTVRDLTGSVHAPPVPELPPLALPLSPAGPAPSGATTAASPVGEASAPAGSAASSIALVAALSAVASVAAAGAAAGILNLLGARAKEWASVLVAPLYTRLTRSDVLGNSTRDGIYTRIRENPGITLTDLTEGGPVARNAVVHHLRILEEQDLVVSRRVGRTRHFYPNGNAPSAEAVVAQSALENATTRAIADRVRAQPGAAQRDLCMSLSISPSLAHWHLSRLEEAGLVTKTRAGRQVQYFWNAGEVIVPPARLG